MSWTTVRRAGVATIGPRFANGGVLFLVEFAVFVCVMLLHEFLLPLRAVSRPGFASGFAFALVELPVAVLVVFFEHLFPHVFTASAGALGKRG